MPETLYRHGPARDFLATCSRGSHDDVTRVHLVPARTQALLPHRLARCGAAPNTRGWAAVMTAPPDCARPPFGYRCPTCFEETHP